MAAPALPDELEEEVLLRFPPQEPALLVRAALVCKRWHSIISDQVFRRRLREFHRAPPTLAAVYNAVDGDAYVARFTPCCASSFPPRADRRGSAVLDCRHGRVLLCDMPLVGELAYMHVLHVWDPVTDEQREVAMPLLPYHYRFMVTAVLCAATATCNHLDCHGGPFLIVLVVVDTDLHDILFYTYSAEAGAWSEPSSIKIGTALNCSYYTSSVAGDTIYFILEYGHRILKYDLVGPHAISVINPPSLLTEGDVALVESKDDGVLGVTKLEGRNLHVWSWRFSGSHGIHQWVKDQIVKLDMVLADATGGPSDDELNVVGFGEGTDIIIVSANAGIFVVWRKSGRVMKVGERRPVMQRYLIPMFCYRSFYTPAMGPTPCISVPLSQSTEVSTKKGKKNGVNSSSGKSDRSRSRCGSISNQPEDLCISEVQTEANKTRGKKRPGVKEKTEKAKKPKQDPSLHIPAMGTRSKTANTSSPAMSTRSKTRSRHICM